VLLTGVLRGAVVFSWSHGAGCRGLSKSYSSKTVSATRRSVRSAPLDLSRSISPRTASRSLNCGEDKSTRLQIFDPGIQELLNYLDNSRSVFKFETCNSREVRGPRFIASAFAVVHSPNSFKRLRNWLEFAHVDIILQTGHRQSTKPNGSKIRFSSAPHKTWPRFLTISDTRSTKKGQVLPRQ
jgi:hypothetical protein